MPSFPDSAVLILLVLLLFGPKKLPVLARQLGKLMNDFRRASNEFRSQMEDELRISEQADRQKQIAAVEAAAPAAPAIEAESVYSNHDTTSLDSAVDAASDYSHGSTDDSAHESTYGSLPESTPEPTQDSTPEATPAPLPIATSGDLSILPPATGLPIANSSVATSHDALPTDSSTESDIQAHQATIETEALHP
jgi:sec-independent protein translocase protein TatB